MDSTARSTHNRKGSISQARGVAPVGDSPGRRRATADPGNRTPPREIAVVALPLGRTRDLRRVGEYIVCGECGAIPVAAGADTCNHFEACPCVVAPPPYTWTPAPARVSPDPGPRELFGGRGNPEGPSGGAPRRSRGERRRLEVSPSDVELARAVGSFLVDAEFAQRGGGFIVGAGLKMHLVDGAKTLCGFSAVNAQRAIVATHATCVRCVRCALACRAQRGGGHNGAKAGQIV
jgi:hypothetical protein